MKILFLSFCAIMMLLSCGDINVESNLVEREIIVNSSSSYSLKTSQGWFDVRGDLNLTTTVPKGTDTIVIIGNNFDISIYYDNSQSHHKLVSGSSNKHYQFITYN